MGAHDTAGLSALPSLVTVKESTLSLTTIHYKGFPGVFLNGISQKYQWEGLKSELNATKS